MIHQFNTLEHLLTQEQHSLYLATEYPFRIKILRDALDEKLKEDPEYEVFAPLSYWKCEPRMTDKQARVLIEPYKYFISNMGRILSTQGKEALLLATTINSSGYPQTTIPVAGKSHSLTIHRAVGCIFTPLTEALGPLHPKDLEVNHMDGIKINFSVGNLEWVTQSGNQTHAVENGLRASGADHPETKPVKGRVVRGSFIGYEFILFGGNHLESFGFDQAAVSNAVSGNLKSHVNCSFSFATEEEIKDLPKGPSEEVLEDLKKTNPLAKFKTVGTNLITGKIVEAIGKAEIKALGFSPGAIDNVIAGKAKSSGGYAWVRIPL